MAVDSQQITSLRKPPEGWEPTVLGRREWGAPHPAYNTLPNRHVPDGPRDDAEAAAHLPELTPGLSRLPTACPRCRSGFLSNEPPLDGDPRGRIVCNGCGRQICWLRADVTAPRRSTVAAPVPIRPVASTPPSGPAPVAVQGRFNRRASCGPACSVVYGHDPDAHEASGQLELQAATAERSTGQVRTGPLVIDHDTGIVTVEGTAIDISATEARILAVLADRLGRLCSAREIVIAVWDEQTAAVWAGRRGLAFHPLRVHLTRLRQKLGTAGELIVTTHGRGYTLLALPPVEPAETDEQPPRARPRLRPGRLHHRLALGPGRAGGLVVARSRPRGVRPGQGVQRPPFRIPSEVATVSTTNGSTTIETVEPAVVVTEVTPIAADEVIVSTEPATQLLQPAPERTPTVPPSALDQALGWVADVVKLRDALAEEEAELYARLERVRSTRERLGQVVAIFEAPTAAAPSPATGERRRGPAPLAGRWSRKHEACVICGRSDRPHKSGGRCSGCDSKVARLAANERSKEQTS